MKEYFVKIPSKTLFCDSSFNSVITFSNTFIPEGVCVCKEVIYNVGEVVKEIDKPAEADDLDLIQKHTHRESGGLEH